MKRSVPAPETLLGGIARLAFFNASGFAGIGSSRQAFLSSMAPLVAFLLVRTGLQFMSAGWRAVGLDALQSLCVLLGQPVISHALARLWKRDAAWLRYATALNWCMLVIPIVAIGFVMALLVLGAVGPSPRMLAYALLGVVSLYWLLLNWFLAWRGLDLPAGKATLFLLLLIGAMVLMLAIPMAAQMALSGTAGPPALVT